MERAIVTPRFVERFYERFTASGDGIAAAFARNYQDLLIARALLGVGEACYATIAPSIIADLYSKDLRSRKLAYFYLATPVGSALGYILGGYIGEFYGWRAVFLVGGLPGLLFALLAFLMVEPRRGQHDDEVPASEPGLSLGATLGRLLKTPAWRINTIGLALLTFTIGGLALWMPSYLERVHGMSSGQAGTIFGGVTVIAGICGTLLGGRLGDRMQARSPGGFFRLSGIGLLASRMAEIQPARTPRSPPTSFQAVKPVARMAK